MSNTAIKVENLSKVYRLGEIGTGSIGQDVDRWFKTKILGKEDPFLKIGETNDRANKGKSDIVYSLQDINFEIQQGDAVGIIGRNGAGKSTLLKILSRVTTPTTGRINIKGRVASLLEVGTGFHPELTGRENIYLNGAILGMRKREIDRKLDEIIDFSGVERYIDTPVKRYSSGMYVRLAFAVAAHLESEILIVDEVLAVGDAEFQKKCLGKMGEVSKGEGRTVLFVSHNMAAVQSLCGKGIMLENGLVKSVSSVNQVIANYQSVDLLPQWINYSKKDDVVNLYSVDFISSQKEVLNNVLLSESFYCRLKISISKDCLQIGMGIHLRDSEGVFLFSSLNVDDAMYNGPVKKGDYEILVEIPGNLFNDISLLLSVGFFSPDSSINAYFEDIIKIDAIDDGVLKKNYFGSYGGKFRPALKWHVSNES
jgi:lipopolysaccharide transport system ATP-binding protein